MPRPKVFVTRLILEVGLSKIRAVCDAEIWTEPLPPPRDVFLRKIEGKDGLLTLVTENPIDGAVMDAAGPQLKVISNYAVGCNNINIQDATARGICVGNTPGVLTEATADMAFGLLISAARCILNGADDARNGRWKTWELVPGSGRIQPRPCHRGSQVRDRLLPPLPQSARTVVAH